MALREVGIGGLGEKGALDFLPSMMGGLGKVFRREWQIVNFKTFL